MENGGTTIMGIIYWAVFAAFYGVSSFLVEPLRHPLVWPILLSALAIWVFLLRLPYPFIFRAMGIGMSLFAIWYSFGFI